MEVANLLNEKELITDKKKIFLSTAHSTKIKKDLETRGSYKSPKTSPTSSISQSV